MHGRKRRNLKAMLAAGLAMMLLIIAPSCQSTEETVPEPPQITAPLADGGFQNLASNRALTPEEWARLMGYVDISDTLPEEDGEDISIDTPEQDEALDFEGDTTPADGEVAPESGVSDDDEILEFETPSDTEDEDGLPDWMRVIPEEENGTRFIADGEASDMGYEDGVVHLAGETPVSGESDTDEDSGISVETGSIRLVDDGLDADDGEDLDPSVIDELAEASRFNRPGQATILTYIREHYSLLFLAAFGLLAVIIFVSMTRYASTGDEDEAKKVVRKKRLMKIQEEETRQEEFDASPIPGKSFVFGLDDMDEPSRPPKRKEKDKPEMSDGEAFDELALEPVEDIPSYEEMIGEGKDR